MLMLIDAPGLWYRAFYALPSSMRSPDGLQINAVRGFFDGIATLVRNHSPHDVVCAVDNDWRPQWRVDLLSSYKAHRVADDGDEEEPDSLGPQIEIIIELLAAAGIPTIGADNYEADDVLATLASRSQGPVDVVTGDRDLFQLIDDSSQVRVIYLGPGIAKAAVYDEAAILARYGITASQYVLFAVLRGDPSDGLPGVKGVGDKTAAKLLNEYGDLDELVTACSDPQSSLTPRVRKAILGAQSYLGAAVPVVRTVRDIALPEIGATPRDKPKDGAALTQIASRYGLGGSMTRFQQALWPDA